MRGGLRSASLEWPPASAGPISAAKPVRQRPSRWSPVRAGLPVPRISETLSRARGGCLDGQVRSRAGIATPGARPTAAETCTTGIRGRGRRRRIRAARDLAGNRNSSIVSARYRACGSSGGGRVGSLPPPSPTASRGGGHRPAQGRGFVEVWTWAIALAPRRARRAGRILRRRVVRRCAGGRRRRQHLRRAPFRKSSPSSRGHRRSRSEVRGAVSSSRPRLEGRKGGAGVYGGFRLILDPDQAMVSV